jgi:uncharacterized membrane protein
MIGRLLGLLAGAAIAALGYGLWKPAEFAKYVEPKYLDLAHVELGPFAPYKTVLAILTIVLGVAVALAGVQRRSGPSKEKKRPAAALFSEAAASPAPFTFDAEPEGGHEAAAEPEAAHDETHAEHAPDHEHEHA